MISVIPKWSSGFLCFLQFKSEFLNKESMVCATANSWSCFCWLYETSSSLGANNIVNLISVLTIWWCPCVETSVFLEEGVCYDQCVLLAKLCYPLPCFILYSKAKFACYPRYSWLHTFAFQSTIMKKKTSFGVLVLKGLNASNFGKLSSGHRTGKGKFSFQSQRKAMPKNVQITAQLHSSHMLAK